jgi:hypothetical protein
VGRVSAGCRAEPPPTLKAGGIEVSCLARQFGLSDTEFDRYVDIGLIAIAPVIDPASREEAVSFTVRFGNKTLTVALHDNQPTGYTMRYLRGKNSGAPSPK